MKRSTIFLLCMLMVSTTSHSQIPSWQWTKGAAGSSRDYGMQVCSDLAGNFYVTGYFTSPTLTMGSFTLTNASGGGSTEDVFISKYDPQGNVVWAIAAGSNMADEGYGICSDAAGNVYVTGFFTGTVTFGAYTLAANGFGRDIFVLKINSSGSVIWAKKEGGTSSEDATGIYADGQGNVYVAGDFFSSVIAVGNTTLVNFVNTGNSSDALIIKYDSTGNVVWAISAGGSGWDYAGAICTESSGNIIVSGGFQSASIAFNNNACNNNTGGGTSRDVFLGKFDQSGTCLWLKSYGGTGNDGSAGLACDLMGNIFLCGYFPSVITFGNSSLFKDGLEDIFLAKVDGSGNALWARKAGGTGMDIANRLCVDGGGNVYLTGFTESSVYSFDNITHNNLAGPGGFSSGDLFVAAYSGNGIVKWVHGGGSAAGDYGMGICVDPAGSIAVVGYYFDPAFTLGTNTLTNLSGGTAEIFITKTLGGATAIKDEVLTERSYFYPNPVSETVGISFKDGLFNASLFIRNSIGEEVCQVNGIYGDRYIYDCKNLPAGVYFFTLKEQGNLRSSEKVVINK